MPEAHSYWSASGFEAVMLCPGKRVMEAGLPDSTSKYAAEGTAAHQVLTWALQESRPAAAYIGRVIEADGFTFTVDDDMAGHVQVCVDYVYDVAGEHGVVLVDRRVNYARYLDVPETDAWGTLDVAVLLPDELLVVDFKYGQGVEVSAEKNPQMSLYGLGALTEFGDLGDFRRVRLVISQPRISRAPSEYDLTVEELEDWGRTTARSAVCTAKNAAADSTEDKDWQEVFLRPGEKQCKFCRAKATCPALRAEATSTVFVRAPATPEEFDETLVPGAKHIAPTDSAWLAAAMNKADLIEDWLKAVRAEVERRLLAGQQVPGFKLVEGKLGNRQWANEAEAEAALKAMRLKHDQMYEYSLISPTTAEKLAPKFDKEGRVKPGQEQTPLGERQWKKLQPLIKRAPAKKHVAPESDPRPALQVTPVTDDFEPVPDAQPSTFDVAEFA